MVLRFLVRSFVLFVSAALFAQVPTAPPSQVRSKASETQARDRPLDPKQQELFQAGEGALKNGDLGAAETSFRSVLALNPQAAGAYANLGVIEMRRKQWQRAREMLRRAESLAPDVPGIRLNMGLTYYRQGDYASAIAPFKTVVRDVPGSLQARHLLGLCYLFVAHYADAVTTLEPLWPQESDQLNYLYALGIAAGEAKNLELEQRALDRLLDVGQNSPEVHMLMGKAYINHEKFDEALTELNLAAQANPKLPFVHFNLGFAYLKKQNLERAQAEFLADIAIEPEVAYNYEQLGLLYSQQQEDKKAEAALLQAVRLDPRLTDSHVELARVFDRQRKYAAALTEINTAGKLDPASYTIHYLRGQVLRHMGREKEAKAEIETYTRMFADAREKGRQALEQSALPNPELARDPQ
ncbi:MAG: tetratricopeptide repeat protein [Candidatus Sulfotelmatobacter sp.]